VSARSKFLLQWEARDQSLACRTGQVWAPAGGGTTQTNVDQNGIVVPVVVGSRFGVEPISKQFGLWLEQPRQNWILFGADFSNAAWVPATMTKTTGVLDPAGNFNAVTLTATAGAAQVAQFLSASTSIVRVNSVYLRRRTGVGQITLWAPDNATQLHPVLTSQWQRFYVANAAASR
jgi:hypothetical protein